MEKKKAEVRRRMEEQSKSKKKKGFMTPERKKKLRVFILKFMFSKKAAKFEKMFTVDLMLCSKCQVDGEDFVNFCGLLRKHEL